MKRNYFFIIVIVIGYKKKYKIKLWYKSKMGKEDK